MRYQQTDLKEIDAKIRLIKKTAEELGHMADNFPALSRNTARIMASLKMLEINISDVLDLNGQD